MTKKKEMLESLAKALAGASDACGGVGVTAEPRPDAGKKARRRAAEVQAACDGFKAGFQAGLGVAAGVVTAGWDDRDEVDACTKVVMCVLMEEHVGEALGEVE